MVRIEFFRRLDDFVIDLLLILYSGYLQYLDISLGKEIFCNHVGEPGSLNVMKSNPTNGIIHLGHSNGTVTLWSPNQKSYVAKMLCHTVSNDTLFYEKVKRHLKSNILDTSISLDGNYMATSSMDSSIRIWDLRTWKNIAIHRLPKGARNIQFSQKGKLATAFENVVEVWNGKLVTKDDKIFYEIIDLKC